MHRAACLAVALIFSSGIAAQQHNEVPATLPSHAVATLVRSLAAAEPFAKHVWRDTPPFNPDGTLNGYVEIARGDRRKWEFDMGANRRAVDRVLPEDVGGYPVNYGFVPQTVSYDGDPFDVLVLGPPIDGGTLVRGVVVGVMRMEDEKGLDSKVVLSRAGADGRPLHALQAARSREVLEGTRLGQRGRRAVVCDDHARVLPRLPRASSAAVRAGYATINTVIVVR
jgi:hypothetical protein